MNTRLTILSAYDSVLKRLRSWFVPLILILLLVTAYGRTSPSFLYYFGSTETAAAHFYLGWLLTLIWLILVYDFFFRLLNRGSELGNRSAPEMIRRRQASRLTRLVNGIFHLLFFLICFSGLLQYAVRFYGWHPPHIDRLDIRLGHVVLGWLFVSTTLIKTYLTWTHWLTGLIQYLREN